MKPSYVINVSLLEAHSGHGTTIAVAEGMADRRRPAITAASTLLLSALTLLPLRASDSPDNFKGRVDLVTLDVCVRDAAGRFLPTLNASDFLVLEDGAPQQVAFLSPADALPLRVVILIDASASMAGVKLERAIQAATKVADLLEPDDQLEIIAFNQQASIVQAFGEDRSQVRPTLTATHASGTTAFNEAVLVAANELVRARRANPIDVREVIIALSDGEDTASRVGFEEVLGALRRSGAIVYALSLRTGPTGNWLGATWPLMQLASDTGGRALAVPQIDALDTLYKEIDQEVRHLYRIGYVSSDARRDGRWRTLSVRVPSQDTKIQTRLGYYAPRR